MTEQTQMQVNYFVGFGSALSMVISYDKWHSIIWAIIHGFFSWFYVIYYIIQYS